MNLILHITQPETWKAAQARGSFTAESLQTEGFIHCSTKETVAKVANRVYPGQSGLILLCIDSDRVQPEVKWEGPYGGDMYPHIYGPLNPGAVIGVVDFPPGPDGTFTLPDVDACI